MIDYAVTLEFDKETENIIQELIDEYLDDIEENFPEVAFPIIELNWCNLSHECLGNAMFNSSTGETILD